MPSDPQSGSMSEPLGMAAAAVADAAAAAAAAAVWLHKW